MSQAPLTLGQTSGPIQWSTVSKTWLHLSCPARKIDHRKTRGILFFPHDKTLQGIVNSTELFKLCLGMCPSPLLLPITVLMQFWDLYWVTLTVKLALSPSQTHKICITGLLLDNNIDLVYERSHNPHHRCITECTHHIKTWDFPFVCQSTGSGQDVRVVIQFYL